MRFFEESESAAYRIGLSPKTVAQTVAQRYMADNPANHVVLAAAADEGFSYDNQGRIVIDFDKKYPNAAIGSYAYAFGYFISDSEMAGLSITLLAEAWVYIDGELITQTTKEDENINKRRVITFNVKKGKVGVFVKCRKNRAGFGAIIGTPTKWLSTDFYHPYHDILGMAYSGVYEKDIFADNIPKIGETLNEEWYPKMIQRENFCEDIDGTYYAATYFYGKGKVKIRVDCEDETAVYVDGEAKNEKNVTGGEHYIFLRIKHKKGNSCRFNILVTADGRPCSLYSKVKGIHSSFLFSPILKNEPVGFETNFREEILLDGNTYWHTEYEAIGIRVLNMERNFGRWNYPLGVVMYGMTETARKLGSEIIGNYVDQHMKIAAGMFDYSRYDTEKYGFPAVMQQIAEIDSLDDCGSFANAVLNYAGGIDGFEKVAALVSDYILNRQERLSDGIFYREKYGTMSELTIWADDMYMSLPFLCRMYEYTNDEKYLEEITKQALLFKQYLYMPEKQLLSHIYSVKYDKKTGIHWGRGNGWALFTLTEILRVLPKKHESYSEILEWFRELSEGFYKCIDEVGMLHQLLNDQKSYMETSCTAMCITAYARGIISGWLEDKKYEEAVYKMWKALCEFAIRYNGDVYGVCQGSSFSFREDYYKNELPWCINDTHGTGIVLLAAMAVNNINLNS